MTEIGIIGLYRIEPTLDSIIQAARYHECSFLLDEKGEYVDEIYWENLTNLGLIEVQIRGSFTPRDLLFSLSHNDQAPYMEYYLDSSGERLLTEDEAINNENRRMCFFCHFIDRRIPIMFEDQKLDIPEWSSLPERLLPFTHYLPVD